MPARRSAPHSHAGWHSVTAYAENTDLKKHLLGKLHARVAPPSPGDERDGRPGPSERLTHSLSCSCPAAEHADSQPRRHAVRVLRGQAGGLRLPVRQAAALQGVSEGRAGHVGEEAARAGPVPPDPLSPGPAVPRAGGRPGAGRVRVRGAAGGARRLLPLVSPWCSRSTRVADAQRAAGLEPGAHCAHAVRGPAPPPPRTPHRPEGAGAADSLPGASEGKLPLGLKGLRRSLGRRSRGLGRRPLRLPPRHTPRATRLVLSSTS